MKVIPLKRQPIGKSRCDGCMGEALDLPIDATPERPYSSSQNGVQDYNIFPYGVFTLCQDHRAENEKS